MGGSMQNLSQGFSSSSRSGSGSAVTTVIIMIIVIAAVYFAYKLYVYLSAQGSGKSVGSQAHNQGKLPQLFSRRPPEVISAQRKVISDIISEFRKREFLAESVPFAVLEKFAEYFYTNLGRLKINASDVKKMIIATYPILPNLRVEVEAVVNGALYIFDRKVLSVQGSRIAIEKIEPAPISVGSRVLINFSKGMEFITGESRLEGIQWDRMMFTYPKNLKIFNERRYARIPVNNVNGKVFSAQLTEPVDITVIDISLEGIKIKTATSLKKKVIYKLSFGQIINGIDYSFSNIEAIVSKSIVVERGNNGYGMAFLYLDIETKQKLSVFLKTMAEIIKASSNR
jgi:hypothetical protein